MPKPKTPKEYEQLGKAVAAIYETGYLDKKQSYKMSFFKGIASGFGGVLGATVLIGLLLWLLSLFSTFPLIGRVSENLNNTIDRKLQNR